MHIDALTESAKGLLPRFKNLEGFYLAGGTALALQLGHRYVSPQEIESFFEAEIKKLNYE